MATLVTVEEFRTLKDPPGVRLELHNGEVVEVTRPKYKHALIQRRIFILFETILSGRGRAFIEFTFRPYPEHEVRVADVGWVGRKREVQIDLEDNLQGAPDIVVEVLSPSNTTSEMLTKKDLCFNAGCQQFWIVDPKAALIEVSLSDRTSRIFHRGDRIPLGDSFCSVDEILDDVDYQLKSFDR